jgi:hypothetical protein
MSLIPFLRGIIKGRLRLIGRILRMKNDKLLKIVLLGYPSEVNEKQAVPIWDEKGIKSGFKENYNTTRRSKK